MEAFSDYSVCLQLWEEIEKSKDNMSDINVLPKEVGPHKQKVLRWNHCLEYFLIIWEDTYLNIPA